MSKTFSARCSVIDAITRTKLVLMEYANALERRGRGAMLL